MVLPGHSARVDKIGNLLIEPGLEGTNPMTARILETNSTHPSAAIDVEGVTVDLIENALRQCSRGDGRGFISDSDVSRALESRAIASR